jgi:hypothetical protein
MMRQTGEAKVWSIEVLLDETPVETQAEAHALAPPCEDDGVANVVHRILSAKAKRESE